MMGDVNTWVAILMIVIGGFAILAMEKMATNISE